MIVRYARARGYKGQGDDPHFTLEKDYLALGVHWRPGGRPAMVIIQSDSDGAPTMLELQYFDVIDPAIPKDWGFFGSTNGYYNLIPQAFDSDVLERYHDDDVEARGVFTRVVAEIQAFHAEVAAD